MIYDIACPVMASKLPKAFNRLTLLVEMQILSHRHLVKHETTHANIIGHCLYLELEYTKHMGINAHPKLVIV